MVIRFLNSTGRTFQMESIESYTWMNQFAGFKANRIFECSRWHKTMFHQRQTPVIMDNNALAPPWARALIQLKNNIDPKRKEWTRAIFAARLFTKVLINYHSNYTNGIVSQKQKWRGGWEAKTKKSPASNRCRLKIKDMRRGCKSAHRQFIPRTRGRTGK